MTDREQSIYQEEFNKRVGNRLAFMVVSSTIEKLAEEMVAEMMRDEEFRRLLRDITHRSLTRWIEGLATEPTAEETWRPLKNIRGDR
jgi:hypothetical protein